MLTGPLSGIVMMLAGTPVASADTAAAKSRNSAPRMLPLKQFDLPRSALPSLRLQLSPSQAPDFANLRAAPQRNARFSVAGLAMGMGAAAVDRDRLDMRVLRLDRGRGGRMSGPLDAGFRLKLTGDRRWMNADVGLTGGVASLLGKALTD